MYAHQVIETLKCHRNKPGFFSSQIDLTIKDIKEAQHFYMGRTGNLSDVLNLSSTGHPLFMDDYGEYVNPPFLKCWFDYELDYPSSSISKTAFLVKQIHDRWIIANCFDYDEDRKFWCPFPYSYLIGLNRASEDYGLEQMKTFIDTRYLQGRLAANIFATSHYAMCSLPPKSEADQVMEGGCTKNGVLNHTLMLLNCKNIDTNIVPAPSKLNKKRRSKGKCAIFRYHTLKLTLPQEKKSINISKSDPKQGVNGVHLCRGHFKTFTKENPLFGKHVGRYWWPSNLRGSKDKGLIGKDYSVQTTDLKQN